MSGRFGSVDLSNLFDHPGSYISFEPTEDEVYVNVLPQVRSVRKVFLPGVPVSVDVDREDRVIGIAFKWNPDSKS